MPKFNKMQQTEA